MPRLQIGNARERALVAAADSVLGAAAAGARAFTHRSRPEDPRRILLLRLERIGDLVMSLPAIRDLRLLAPSAQIDLVVGAWNAALAATIPFVDRVETLSADWLAREEPGAGIVELVRTAWRWRDRAYDLAVNFEPDVRSNLLLRASGASWTAGWSSGGGGPLLDTALEYRPREHTTANARRLVATVFGRTAPDPVGALLALPESAARAAGALLPAHTRGPLVGVHASGGRAIKQWDPARFREVARRLIEERDATVVLTGSPSDRSLVASVSGGLAAAHVVDLAGDLDLAAFAALLQRFRVLVTGDTGPMHLAHAVGTPVVAIFGPSDPVRYAPSSPRDRVVRADLPCSPCNRIRNPPERCVGHTPDCLADVSVDRVLRAVNDVLEAPLPGVRLPRATAAG